jgi:hypothetical protein
MPATNLPLDARSQGLVALKNQEAPKDGGKALELPLMDFSQANQFSIDFMQFQDLGFITMVQTMWIDMSTSDAPMQVTINGSQQIIVAKGRTQGYYNVMAPNPVKFVFSCPGGPGLDVTTGRIGVRVHVLNVPIAGVTWPTV